MQRTWVPLPPVTLSHAARASLLSIGGQLVAHRCCRYWGNITADLPTQETIAYMEVGGS